MESVTINPTNPIMEILEMSVIRSGNTVLEGINLTVNPGEFVGVVGPNGSGKSTLLLTILGLLKPRTGSIKIYDEHHMSSKLKGKIGWVSQAAAHLPKEVKLTVEELVHLGTLKPSNFLPFFNKNGRQKAKKAMQLVGLTHLANWDMSKLSGGQRQRAVIAKALASDADFILLDEPLVGIDRESRNSLLKLLDVLCHDEGKTILMISHDLTSIKQTAHRVIYLEQSIRYDGPASEFPDQDELAELRGIKNVHDYCFPTCTSEMEEE